MAKIAAEFDTVNKTLEATVDGKPVQNLHEVHFHKSYADDESYGCSLVTKEDNQEHDMRTYTHLHASESKDGKAAVADGTASESKQIPGFVAATKSKLEEDIARYFE